MRRVKEQSRTGGREKGTTNGTATRLGEAIIRLIQINPDLKRDIQEFCDEVQRAKAE